MLLQKNEIDEVGVNHEDFTLNLLNTLVQQTMINFVPSLIRRKMKWETSTVEHTDHITTYLFIESVKTNVIVCHKRISGDAQRVHHLKQFLPL